VSSSEAECFSPDYATARARFRNAARGAGATLEQLPLRAAAPDGSALGIDIAWLGSRRPARAVLHSSGLHGVEGFAGSAIQLALLARLPSVPEDGALIFVHILNPYGMAWLRRCNENNVDLNRNFDDEVPREGAPKDYTLIHRLLNPPTPPRRDFFYLRAAYYAARYGFEPLKQAIAGGQYEYPDGLFFGGTALEEGPSLYQRWLAENLSAVRQLYAVDVHTGLGPWGHDSLVAHRPTDDVGLIERALGRGIPTDAAPDSVIYKIRGGYARAFDAVAAHTRVCLVTQEFGTFSSVRMLHALREENRAHHYARMVMPHPAKRHLRNMFSPPSSRWRTRVVRSGRRLTNAMFNVAFPGRDGDKPP
jgi:predicted deacylase